MHTMEVGTANVPAFLTKLWKLVEDPTYCDLISWSSNGRSFVIKNPTRFSKELLPLFFKHNNMASFIRQLNMYGFRKLTSIENSGLRSERDEMEFYHQYFLKQQENLLEYIKRKASTNNSSSSSSSGGHHHHHGSGALVANGHNHGRHGSDHHNGCPGVEEVHELLASIMQRQDAQENFRVSVQNEYSTLWKEIAYLRQQNNKQQAIVQRLIQFLMSLVQTQNQRNNVSPNKRKATLMIDDVDGSSTLPPAAKRLNLEAGPFAGTSSALTTTSSALTAHSNGSPNQVSREDQPSFPEAGLNNSRSENAIKSGIFDAITSGLSNGPTIHDVTDDVIDTELEAAANSNPTISLPNAAEIDRPDLPAPLFQDIDLDVLSQVLEMTSSTQQQLVDEEDDDECLKDGGCPLDPELLLQAVLPIVSQASLPPLVSSLVSDILTNPTVKCADRAGAASINNKNSQSVNYWSHYDSLSVPVSSSGPTAAVTVPTETPDYLIDPSSLLEDKDADLPILIPDVTNGDHHATSRNMAHCSLNRDR